MSPSIETTPILGVDTIGVSSDCLFRDTSPNPGTLFAFLADQLALYGTTQDDGLLAAAYRAVKRANRNPTRYITMADRSHYERGLILSLILRIDSIVSPTRHFGEVKHGDLVFLGYTRTT